MSDNSKIEGNMDSLHFQKKNKVNPVEAADTRDLSTISMHFDDSMPHQQKQVFPTEKIKQGFLNY